MKINTLSGVLLAALLLLGGFAPLHADPAPDWIVGLYHAHNRKYNVDVDLSIYPDGNVKSFARFRDGKTSRDTGTYQDGQIKMGSGTFDLVRNDDGFRLVQTNDRSNRAEYRLVDRNPVPGQHTERDHDGDRGVRVPDWLIGRFEGVNHKYQVVTQLTIRPDGSVSSIAHFRDGRHSTDSGSFRRGKITVGSGTYYVDPTHRGFRLTQAKDETNVAEYHRIDN